MPTLEWNGKEKVIKSISIPTNYSLKRIYSFDENGQHQNDNGSSNMIIHGDNLEALKALLPKFKGKIKCIYIDPPYNTGTEQWIYNDNMNDPKIREWIGKVVGKEEEDLSRHDKWLCMMYPRLVLLHDLLSEDGAIFISINDNEISNLITICDEIFNRKNRLKQFVWCKDGHKDNQDDIINAHEYIISYTKNKKLFSTNNIVDPNIPKDSKILRNFVENSITKNGFKNPPSDITLPIGFPCTSKELSKECHPLTDSFLKEVKGIGYISRELTEKYKISYPIVLDKMVVNNFKLSYPCTVFSGWMNKSKLIKFINNGCNPIEDNGSYLEFFLSNNGVIYYKRTGRTPKYIKTILQNLGTPETNKYMLERMGINFDYPKPVELLNFILQICGNEDDYFLDSFAGSGTTAHAILNINAKNASRKKFILIEFNDYAETITVERIKKVITGFNNKGNFIKGTGGDFSFYELV